MQQGYKFPVSFFVTLVPLEAMPMLSTTTTFYVDNFYLFNVFQETWWVGSDQVRSVDVEGQS